VIGDNTIFVARHLYLVKNK